MHAPTNCVFFIVLCYCVFHKAYHKPTAVNQNLGYPPCTVEMSCGSMVTACPSHVHLVHVHTQILSKSSAGSDLKLSKTEEQGSAVTPGVEEEEETGRQLPRGRLQWFLMLDYR